jgi:hypothetical protein
MTYEQAENILALLDKWYCGGDEQMHKHPNGGLIKTKDVLRSLEALPDAEEWKARAEKAEAEGRAMARLHGTWMEKWSHAEAALRSEPARLREAFVGGMVHSRERYFELVSAGAEALRRYPDAPVGSLPKCKHGLIDKACAECHPVEKAAEMMRCRLADDCPYRKDCPLSKPHVENQGTPLRAPPIAAEGHQCKYVFCKWSTGCGTECLPVEQPAEPEDILAGLESLCVTLNLDEGDKGQLRTLARRSEERAVARAMSAISESMSAHLRIRHEGGVE